MTACVVDASVAAAAFFQETHSDAARGLLSSGRALHAPDLIWAELANVIWKRYRLSEIDEAEASDLLADTLALPLRITPADELLEAALELAMRTGRTVYDCLYLALAVKTDTPMITANRRLVRALAAGPLKPHIVWIGDSDEKLL